MAEELNLNINVDSSQLDKAGNKIKEVGEHTGGLRKELRATTEATKGLGEAFGGASKDLGALSEGSRMAYAGFELMEGGLKGLADTMAANPFLLAAIAIAAVVVSLGEMNKEFAKTRVEVIKSGEKLKEFGKMAEDADRELAQAKDDLALANGTLTKSEYDRLKALREGQKIIEQNTEKQAKSLGELRLNAINAGKAFEASNNWLGKLTGQYQLNLDAKNKALKELNDAEELMVKSDKDRAEAASKKADAKQKNDEKKDDKKDASDLKKAEEKARKELKIRLDLDKAILAADKDNLVKKKKVLDDELAEKLMDADLTESEILTIKKTYEQNWENIQQEARSKQEAESIKEAEFYKKLMEETAKEQEKAKERERKNTEKTLELKLKADKDYAAAHKLSLNVQYQVVSDEQDLEIKKINDIRAKQLFDAKDDAEAIKQINQDADDAIVQIKADSAEKIDKINKDSLNKAIGAAQDLNNALQGLSDAYFAFKTENLKKGSQAELDAAKKQFKINKGLSIVNALIHGAEGSAKIWSTWADYPIVAAALQAVEIATVGLQIGKIKNQQFPSSESPGGSVGSGGGGSSMGGFTPQSLQQIGSGQPGFNNPLTPTSQGTNSNNQPSKMYVVASDITSSQNKNAVLDRRASFNH